MWMEQCGLYPECEQSMRASKASIQYIDGLHHKYKTILAPFRHELVIFMTCHRASVTEPPLAENLTIKQLSMLLQLVAPIHVESAMKKHRRGSTMIASLGVSYERAVDPKDTTNTIGSLPEVGEGTQGHLEGSMSLCTNPVQVNSITKPLDDLSLIHI